MSKHESLENILVKIRSVMEFFWLFLTALEKVTIEK